MRVALIPQDNSDVLSAARVALEIGTRRAAHLSVIHKALGEGDDETAAMCMRRFFNLAPCSGATVYCAGCPVTGKGMGTNESTVKLLECN